MGEILDLSKLHPEVELLKEALQAKVVGQERAIRQIIRAYVPTTINMQRSDRPMGVFLFLGPTGVGKSETVKAFAKCLLGSPSAITKIDCTEFQHSHEIAKLLGAPPGYVGDKIEPRLSQGNIDQYQTKTAKVNIILFDEIEKAHDAVFDSIMSILGDGVLTLGNNSTVNFSRSFVFLTSNLGSEETRKMIEGSGIGFGSPQGLRDAMDERIYRSSKESVKRKFRAEFINRLDKIIVFRSLGRESLEKILKIELKNLQRRIFEAPFKGYKMDSGDPIPERKSVIFKLTDAAQEFILKEGTSEIYGARELNRTLDRYIGFPLAALISSGQLGHGYIVKIDYAEGQKDLIFTREDLIQ